MSATPEWLYRIQPTRPAMLAEGPTEPERATVAAHFAYLEGLTAAGVVILAGRTLTTGPESFGIVVFRAESEPAAQAIMAADPAVQAGVMHATLFPYRVALLAPANA